MFSSKWVVVFIAIGVWSVTVANLSAQESGNEERSDFSITSGLSLGLNGFTTSTQFKLVDELGFDYDVMSLLRNPSAREMAGVDEDQYDEIRAIWKDASSQMMPKAAGAIFADEEREQIKQLFHEAQDEILDLMSPDQVDGLYLARHHIAIEQFGMAEYLASKMIRQELGLNTDQLDSLKDAEVAYKSTLEEKIQNELIAANEALINELTEPQRVSLADLLDETSRQAFLKSKLFTGKETLMRNRPRPLLSVLGVAIRGSVRKECKIDDEQYEQIKGLKRVARKLTDQEIESKLTDVLKPGQIASLEKLTIADQQSRFGTVSTLCYGFLGSSLDLNSEDAESLYEIGEQIQTEFVAASKDATAEAIKDSMTALTESQQAQLIRMVGNADPLKSLR